MGNQTLDLTGANILAVDDVPASIGAILLPLEEAESELLIATSGEDALRVATEVVPDLVLLFGHLKGACTGADQGQGGDIEPDHLKLIPGAARPPADEVGMELPLNLYGAERQLIERAMEQTGGNVTAAARLLGIDRCRLYRKMKQWQAD